MPGEIGNTQPQFFTLPESEGPVVLRSGQRLPGYTLAYETYGELSPAKDNAVLVFHALTGTQHAAGHCEEVPGLSVEWTPECQAGWWDAFVGPGKAIDTAKYFVICVNYLGGCYGSTGPSSINPETSMPYGGQFPKVSVADIVDSQVRLVRELGIDCLHAVIGGSLGGMMCISLATRYPDLVKTVIPIASGLATSPLQRLHNFEQIYAIEGDANFKGGDYYDGERPLHGLALARMISHKTFISLETMEDRATREIRQSDDDVFSWYKINRPLESYMHHKGKAFVRRFDANTYLRVIDAWQRFDAMEEAGAESPSAMFAPCQHQNYLIFTIDSDVCFYPGHQSDLDAALREANVPAMRITVHSAKGHDSFLLEPELFTPHLVYALNGGGVG
ncbi:MAG: homoserine O-acetyltransferase [Verrucomicrobiota bacterium]